MGIKKNRIAIVLDKSGSMNKVRESTISAFNEQIEVIQKESKEKGIETKVSLQTFSSEVDEPTIWNRRPSRLKPLTTEDYVPGGMTAMRDAVGSTVDKLSLLKEANDPDTSFLVVVISDGLENNSKEYTSQALASRIKTLQDTERWTFTYIGANQDLAVVSRDLGIDLGNTLSFNATKKGVTAMSQRYGAATSNFYRARAGGQTSVKTDFFAPDTEPEDTPDTEPTKPVEKSA